MRELLKEASEMLSNIESELPNYHLCETHELVQRIESELTKPNPEPIGYIPAYAARIIHNEGSWDAFHLYRTQTDPTDIPVYL